MATPRDALRKGRNMADAQPVAIVTGASSGLGFEIALELARRGQQVFAGLRRPELWPADAVPAVLASALTPTELDVTDDVSVAQAVARIHAEAGRVDVVVNNAGISGGTAVETTDMMTIRQMFDTNVFGSLRVVRQTLPMMRDQHGGIVVQISSVSGRLPLPFNSTYAATKHAIEAFMEALHFEVATFGVRVLIVEPGLYRSQLVENSWRRRFASAVSPYSEREEWMATRARGVMATAAPASEGAAAIVEAALDGTTRLRYPIGPGARKAIDERASFSEAEWADRVERALAGAGPLGSA